MQMDDIRLHKKSVNKSLNLWWCAIHDY
ncbi:hypothetical protein CBM2615_B140199 [Cupriavidus taiwanensis]|uniref:Uncharacterized protein n=1 Tax=Cupriavidus taiwanensis TaxID=164546 RepID=A0A976G3W7_9BURK|nr:hypothetical protein CBM2614_B150141 [Cupriavidus taiwanensis]SOZ64365.1 hypothetical protein CBM2615_B140199 [Cupriavidus taiwanensis]SOZ68112.1 hypothetical protein CBM2613_B110198 [Cupriavidus taiwanensis]SPA07924.1 hypothetical protein CBM2625_B110199 [Cupriavidus taiwanensis]